MYRSSYCFLLGVALILFSNQPVAAQTDLQWQLAEGQELTVVITRHAFTKTNQSLVTNTPKETTELPPWLSDKTTVTLNWIVGQPLEDGFEIIQTVNHSREEVGFKETSEIDAPLESPEILDTADPASYNGEEIWDDEEIWANTPEEMRQELTQMRENLVRELEQLDQREFRWQLGRAGLTEINAVKERSQIAAMFEKYPISSGANSLLQNMAFLFPKFPQQAIAPGHSWKSNATTPLSVAGGASSGNIKLRYSYQGQDDQSQDDQGLEQISFAGRLQNVHIGKQPVEILESQVEGTLSIDPTLQQPSELTATIQAKTKHKPRPIDSDETEEECLIHLTISIFPAK